MRVVQATLISIGGKDMQDLKWQSSSHTMINKENITKVITPIGEIEVSEWMDEIERLAVENNEENILEKIYKYCRKELAWLKMKEFPLPENIEELEEDESNRIIREVGNERRKYREKLERDIKEIALQYYGSRIWEITDWVDYELFNNKYMEEGKQLTM